MAKVILWGGLTALTGGVSELDSEARNVRQLLDELGERFPALEPRLETGVSVAIDGAIFRNSWFEEIKPESVVHVLPYLAGG